MQDTFEWGRYHGHQKNYFPLMEYDTSHGYKMGAQPWTPRWTTNVTPKGQKEGT